MKLEVGIYVRSKNGAIAKIEQIVDNEIRFNIKPIFSDSEEFGYNWLYIKEVIKASHNIIDLIEVGDYVNGYKVCKISKHKGVIELYIDNDGFSSIWAGEIETIVTKEQFEARAYKVG